MTMTIEQLEQVYQHLAEAIDRAGQENESLFLAKLALTLADQLSDPARFKTAIEIALQDLTPVAALADGVP